jgi:hypothetical protein
MRWPTPNFFSFCLCVFETAEIYISYFKSHPFLLLLVSIVFRRIMRQFYWVLTTIRLFADILPVKKHKPLFPLFNLKSSFFLFFCRQYIRWDRNFYSRYNDIYHSILFIHNDVTLQKKSSSANVRKCVWKSTEEAVSSENSKRITSAGFFWKLKQLLVALPRPFLHMINAFSVFCPYQMWDGTNYS